MRRIAAPLLALLLAACARAPVPTPAPAPSAVEVAPVPALAADGDVLPPSRLEPAERYSERDLATVWLPLPGDSGLYLAWADSVVAADPAQFDHRLERAFLRSRQGDHQAAEADFRFLAAREDLNPFQRRRVHWNYGWALLEVDQPVEALRQWQFAEQGHGGRPDWVPLSYALALWRIGEHDRALRFYSAATRTDPRLTSADGLAERVGDWSVLPKETASALFEAWINRGGGA